MNKSESIGKLALALSKAQGQIKGAAKDSENPFFKNKYADLTSVWEACRAQLCANELAIVQTTAPGENDYIVVETTLLHSSGEWISGSLPIKPVKNDPQGIGSAITYARRYALAAMVGVAPEDDDGEAATRPKAVSKKEQPETKSKKQRLVEKIEGYYSQERDLGREPAKTAKPLSEMSEKELLKLGSAVAARVKKLADEKAARE